eukprot:6212425-Pleurochrysis_carterae.AAC.15
MASKAGCCERSGVHSKCSRNGVSVSPIPVGLSCKSTESCSIGAQPFFCRMVSRPCGPRRISLRKLRIATHTIGVMSTPATGGMTERVPFSSGSVGHAATL